MLSRMSRAGEYCFPECKSQIEQVLLSVGSGLVGCLRKACSLVSHWLSLGTSQLEEGAVPPRSGQQDPRCQGIKNTENNKIHLIQTPHV